MGTTTVLWAKLVDHVGQEKLTEAKHHPQTACLALIPQVHWISSCPQWVEDHGPAKIVEEYNPLIYVLSLAFAGFCNLLMLRLLKVDCLKPGQKNISFNQLCSLLVASIVSEIHWNNKMFQTMFKPHDSWLSKVIEWLDVCVCSCRALVCSFAMLEFGSFPLTLLAVGNWQGSELSAFNDSLLVIQN